MNYPEFVRRVYAITRAFTLKQAYGYIAVETEPQVLTQARDMVKPAVQEMIKRRLMELAGVIEGPPRSGMGTQERVRAKP